MIITFNVLYFFKTRKNNQLKFSLHFAQLSNMYEYICTQILLAINKLVSTSIIITPRIIIYKIIGINRRYIDREFPESQNATATNSTTVYSVPRTFQKCGEKQASLAEERVFHRLQCLNSGDRRPQNTFESSGVWVTFFHSACYGGQSFRNQRVGKLIIREHDFVVFAKYAGKFVKLQVWVREITICSKTCSFSSSILNLSCAHNPWTRKLRLKRVNKGKIICFHVLKSVLYGGSGCVFSIVFGIWIIPKTHIRLTTAVWFQTFLKLSFFTNFNRVQYKLIPTLSPNESVVQFQNRIIDRLQKRLQQSFWNRLINRFVNQFQDRFSLFMFWSRLNRSQKVWKYWMQID